MQNKHIPQPQTLQPYPCDYTFKVFGAADMQQHLIMAVRAAVSQVVELPSNALSNRSSSGGKYFCVSVNARLQNEDQRRQIYVALQQLEGVRYIL